MKELLTLDRIVLEVAIEDFKNYKQGLNEVSKLFHRYEHKSFDTSEQRIELNKYIEKRLIGGLENAKR